MIIYQIGDSKIENVYLRSEKIVSKCTQIKIWSSNFKTKILVIFGLSFTVNGIKYCFGDIVYKISKTRRKAFWEQNPLGRMPKIRFKYHIWEKNGIIFHRCEKQDFVSRFYKYLDSNAIWCYLLKSMFLIKLDLKICEVSKSYIYRGWSKFQELYRWKQ